MLVIDNCPICKSENTVFVRDDIKECLDCTHKFNHKIPEGFLDRYYDVKYWENDKKAGHTRSKGWRVLEQMG